MSEIEVVEAKQHFPHVAVFEARGRTGQLVLRLAFKNPEFVRGGAKGWGRGLLFLLVMVGGVPALIFGIQLGNWLLPEWGWVLAILLAVLGFVGLMDWLKQPARYDISIEIDSAEDRLRVVREGRCTVERNLSLLQNLTVEPHPEADAVRAERLAKGEKKLSEAERTHCLFGWFGFGGAERVQLVARAEWPERRSLFQVRQAILWAIQRAAGADAPDRARQAAGPAPQAAAAQGLNPPLD